MSGPGIQSYIRRRFLLPSRKLVEIRWVASEHHREVVVRAINLAVQRNFEAIKGKGAAA